MEDKIKSIIRAFLSGNSTRDERKLLLSFLKESNENRSLFKRAYDEWQEQNKRLFAPAKGWLRINKRTSLLKCHRLYGRVAIIAACIIAFIALVSPLVSYFFEVPQIRSYVSVNDEINEPYININPQLTLASNNKVEIDHESGLCIQYSGNDIIINGQSLQKRGEIDSYNILSVPYGMNGQITLGDGTKIWVNANSRIIFPSSFEGASQREIFLKGEIYLEVAHDPSRPFIVRTECSNIRVLGTQFEVRAYSGKSDRIALISGSVMAMPEKRFKRNFTLSPNELCIINDDGRGEVKKIRDAEKLIAWKDGLYISRNEPLSKLISFMRQYYGCQIACSPDVEDLACTGKLHLKSDIETMLSELSYIIPISVSRGNGCYYIIPIDKK